MIAAKAPPTLAELDRRHLLHPWAGLAGLSDDPALIIDRAEGVTVYDAEGNAYLDAIGGMWCVTLGYGRRELVDAMRRQAARMPYYTPFAAMGNRPSIELARALSELAPGDLNRVHFTTSGSDAVDSAVRFCHYYFRATGQPERIQVLSRIDAYHGSTYLGASLSGKRWDRTHFHYETGFVHHLRSPNTYRRPRGLSVEAFADLLVDEFRDKVATLGAERIACFIAEPILASGGVIVPPPGYLKAVREICRQHGIVFIADEIVTGFGRLGHFFASQDKFELDPDIILTAKGLTSGYQPLGAMIVSERLVASLIDTDAIDNNVFTNGYTYSGHPVACAVALANIEVMCREQLCEHVRDVGPYFQRRLKELESFDIVGEVRGDHLMACVEMDVSDRAGGEPNLPDIAVAQRVDAHCQRLGLLVRPYESLSILSPPLIIDRPQIDRMVAILAAAIDETDRDWRGGRLRA